jgi:peptidoglycan/xylan/chitin deacetylase (PgdA/CDA1 family)
VRSQIENRSSQAVFLSYHSVASQGPRFLTVDAELFERQLDILRRRGFKAGGPAELAQARDDALSAPTAFLTFDDGFRNNYDTALPLLRHYGFRAFCFVIPPLVDEGSALSWPEVAADQARFETTMRSVTWPMVEAMKEEGFEIGSHSLSHCHLTELGAEELRQELADSRVRIKERLGSCDTLAYPFGEWNRHVEEAAAQCGYSFAFTLPLRTGQRQATPLSIPRLNVDFRDKAPRFEAKLSALGRTIYLSHLVGAGRIRARQLLRREI